jgi:hypothetical protein
MVLANTKHVQAFVQAVKEVSDLVIQADALAQDYKTKWQAINPDLTGTNLTAGQVSAVNNWITSLNTLRNDAVVTTIQGKDQPSHGTKALE